MNPYIVQLRSPSFRNPTTGQVIPNDTGWQDNHLAALRRPRGFEVPIITMLEGWAKYADQVRIEYGGGLDQVLGSRWADLGRAIHGLLDGETGRLDCGTLSSFIHGALESQGFKDE